MNNPWYPKDPLGRLLPTDCVDCGHDMTDHRRTVEGTRDPTGKIRLDGEWKWSYCMPSAESCECTMYVQR